MVESCMKKSKTYTRLSAKFILKIKASTISFHKYHFSTLYVQLKSGGSYLKKRKSDDKEIFYIKNERLIDYWQSHNYPVMLVIKDAADNIRWMNITDYLDSQAKKTKTIEFDGEDFTPLTVDNLRKELYPGI